MLLQAKSVLDNLQLNACDVDSSSEVDSGSEDEQSNDGDEIDSARSSVGSDIEFYVSCLMNLLPTMEGLLNFSDPIECSKARPPRLHISSSAFSYIQLIQDKFPECSSALAERLGEANWQRHTLIRSEPEEEKNSEAAVIESHKSTFVPVSLFHDSGYATTAASSSSFMTTNTEMATGSLRVPETPQEVNDGKPFTCFICNHTLHRIKNRADWK